MSQAPVTPADYLFLFEEFGPGKRIFEDLVARFYANRAQSRDAMSRVIEMIENEGKSEPLRYIIAQMKIATGESHVGQTVDVDGAGK